MKRITLQELISALDGELLCGGACPETVAVTGAQSDNRAVRKGEVFFAFPGERVDGHRFVGAALEAGACGAVVSKRPDRDIPLPPGRFLLRVPDTVKAYGDLARWYRAQFHIPVIGITGSVGKTTTKDMVASVLAQHYRTARTAGNYNNNIGLPRTVLTIGEETQAAVIEMGMNHKGEISYLTGIARPTTAVITNIGEAHIGNLGSREGIFQAKCEIFEGLETEGGVPAAAILNGDDEYLERLRGEREPGEPGRRCRLLYVGEDAACEYRAVDIEDTLGQAMRFTAVTPAGCFPVTVPAPGRHMIYPALTAIAVGVEHGLSVDELQAGIAAYVSTGMRMETLRLPGNVLIYNDTYNANPQSMKAGLLTLSKTVPALRGDTALLQGDTALSQGDTAAPQGDAAAPRRIAVLGDMFELGGFSEPLHREVGAYAAGLPIDTLVTVGEASAALAQEAVRCGMKDVRVCMDKETAKTVIAELRGADTVWLFKASRGMAMEELVRFLQEI